MAWIAIGTAAAGVATAALSSPSGGGSGAPAASQPGVNPSSGSKIFGQVNYRQGALLNNAEQTATSSASADGSFSPNNGTESAAIPSWVYMAAAAALIFGIGAYALKMKVKK